MGFKFNVRGFKLPDFSVVILCIFLVGCYLSPSLSLAKMIIISVSIVSAVYFALNRHYFWQQIGKEQILLFFLLLTVSSCSWGDTGSFIYALKSALVLLFFVLFISKFKQEIYAHINLILMVIVCSAAILSTIVLYKHLAIHGFNLKARIVVGYGPIVQTIKTAAVLVIALLIMIWAIFMKNGWYRCVCSILFIPVFFTMLLLQSRGAILALCVGVSVLFVAYILKMKNVLMNASIGVVLLVAMGMIGIYFNLEFNPKGISDSERIPIWMQSISEAYPDNIWQGVGYRKDQSIVVSDIKYTHSHNVFISVFRFAGVIGLLSFVGYLYSRVIKRIVDHNLSAEGILFLAWFATAISTLFFDGMYPVYIGPEIFLMLWLPLGLL